MFDQSIDDSTLEEIVDARNEMLDKIGIMQHHDAVTGTEQ